MEDGRPARPAVAEPVREAEMNKPSTQIGLGIALGAGIGAATGVFAGNIAIWLAVGIAIGVAIGSSFRGTKCPECDAVHKTHEAES
jgi:predicted lysophospholipase L1 biosynthesis ABC-type transport system permease subunit